MATHYFKVQSEAELKKITKAFETLFGKSKLVVERGHFIATDGDPVDLMGPRDVEISRRKVVIDLGYEGKTIVAMDQFISGHDELMLISLNR